MKLNAVTDAQPAAPRGKRKSLAGRYVLITLLSATALKAARWVRPVPDQRSRDVRRCTDGRRAHSGEILRKEYSASIAVGRSAGAGDFSRVIPESATRSSLDSPGLFTAGRDSASTRSGTRASEPSTCGVEPSCQSGRLTFSSGASARMNHFLHLVPVPLVALRQCCPKPLAFRQQFNMRRIVRTHPCGVSWKL
jgi:hypothetical protein